MVVEEIQNYEVELVYYNGWLLALLSSQNDSTSGKSITRIQSLVRNRYRGLVHKSRSNC